MQRANSENTRSIPLSELFQNPVLRRIFRDAERDQNGAFVVSLPKTPELTGGAAVELEVVA